MGENCPGVGRKCDIICGEGYYWLVLTACFTKTVNSSNSDIIMQFM